MSSKDKHINDLQETIIMIRKENELRNKENVIIISINQYNHLISNRIIYNLLLTVLHRLN